LAFRSAETAPRPLTDRGDRVYVIGDVHGRYDLLCELMDKLEEHSARLPHPGSLHVILLGDLVDRGPASADVVRLAYETSRQNSHVVTLLGNHEELMIRALDNEPGYMRTWMRVGGAETLRSFGVEPPERGADPTLAIAKARAAIPREWLDWLRKRPLTARSGDYLFCHAGIRPGVALKRQTRADLLWIRDEFLEDRGDHGVVVVHGHSVEAAVEMRHNRIGIDTGAYKTGMLSALYLEGDRQQVLSVQGAASEV
jgi:serine/threonine protein phosphatase 1